MSERVIRLMTCGSVDDGKSTLMGRFLFEIGAIYDDQFEMAAKDSKRFGTQGQAMDFALLLDGLTVEREQGITVDVSYRYFSVGHTRFIVADCPGHLEYTRNMATAASTADIALLIVNAEAGLQSQTMRHATIASMLGIKQLIVVVNKMDLVRYNKDSFEKIKNEFQSKAVDLEFDELHYVPLSALRNQNLVTQSNEMDWYQGRCLKDILGQINLPQKSDQPFRISVQMAIRPNPHYRGYIGTIASGSVAIDQSLFLARTGGSTFVKKICKGDVEVHSASVGDSICLSLSDEIDISRGDVLVSEIAAIDCAHQFEVEVFWIGSEPAFKGRSFEMRLSHQTTIVSLSKIRERLNLESLNWESCQEINSNDIVRIHIACQQSLCFTRYKDCRELGSFILIDRINHQTVAAGTIRFALRRGQNVHAQVQSVDQKMREKLNGHRARVLWFTGLSGSGKSTLANELEKRLYLRGLRTYILDGDNFRLGLNKDLGFSDADRIENIRRAAEVAKLMMQAGVIVITSFISPFEKDRQMAKELIGEENFNLIYLNTCLEICEERDPKGLYKKARQGLIPNFTGIGSTFQAPQNADLSLDTGAMTVENAVQSILTKVFENE